jgi:putative ABC transport system permease protein
MRSSRFIRRQLALLGKQAAVFVICVGLSLTALVAIGGFKQNVNRALLADARSLHAADILVSSAYPLSTAMQDRLKALEDAARVLSVRVYEFYSVVRKPDGSGSLLSSLKAVGPGYPFYGKVQLASGKRFDRVLAPGTVVAEPALLDRLGVAVGERLAVGRKTLLIGDAVLQEPDRPVSFFALGPRLFVHTDDLPGLGLVTTGSRVRHRALVKVLPGQAVDQVAEILRRADPAGQERVETFRSTRSRIKRFFDNFLFFLNLVSIFTLLLSGIGIQSALGAMLRESTPTIAIMKTLGADNGAILRYFIAMVTILGAAGTGLGLAAGFGLQQLLPKLMGDLLFPDIEMAVAWPAVAEGVGLGIGVVALFTFLPLMRLKDLKPILILRKTPPPFRRNGLYWAGMGLVGVFFTGMVFWQLREIRTGMVFVGSAGALILIAAACTQAALWALRRLRFSRPSWRQAQKGLFRTGNATRPIIVTLASAWTVLFAIYLVEANLDASFVKSFPPDAPNLFFVNIQPEQQQAVGKMLDRPSPYYPIIRARLTAVNGQPINAQSERSRRGDNLSRVFNLTYRSELLKDERLSAGERLFRPDLEEVQVSVLDTVSEMRPIRIDDRLTFNIQGVALEARVVSFRSRTRDSVSPFFYFVFEPKVLEKAPQTIFTAVRAAPGEVAGLQRAISTRFPNVSGIDVSQTISRFAGVLARFSIIVRFFTAFSMAAGLLILVGSIFATRQARIREAVYYKILGARSRFVLMVFALESLYIGASSCLVALALAHCAAGVICTRVFDIPYRFFPDASAAMVMAAMTVVTAVSLLSSVSILRQRPVQFLRTQPD